VNVKIDEGLKKKCPRVALGCVTARVEAGVSPAALTEEMKTRDAEIQKLPFPRGVLASPQVEATRAAYKALGKDPARYRNSAEALLRRVVGGIRIAGDQRGCGCDQPGVGGEPNAGGAV
jgi:DNA/RNA-binding domain of Phe-tRNA-synthetase-like protein